MENASGMHFCHHSSVKLNYKYYGFKDGNLSPFVHSFQACLTDIREASSLQYNRTLSDRLIKVEKACLKKQDRQARASTGRTLYSEDEIATLCLSVCLYMLVYACVWTIQCMFTMSLNLFHSLLVFFFLPG